MTPETFLELHDALFLGKKRSSIICHDLADLDLRFPLLYLLGTTRTGGPPRDFDAITPEIMYPRRIYLSKETGSFEKNDMFGFFRTFSRFFYTQKRTIEIVMIMKPHLSKKLKITLSVLSVAAAITCAGVILYYPTLFGDSRYDSFCQDCPPITQAELDAGWYWGFSYQKKPGTPDTWIHVGGDSLSARWIDPNKISDVIPLITQDELAAGWYFAEVN